MSTRTAADQTPQIDAAHRELADLQAKLDAVRRELAASVGRRDQALEECTKATAAADQAQHAWATLNHEIEQLGAASAASEKQLADLAERRDKSRAELTEDQRAADTLVGEIERLTTAKAAIEQDLAIVKLSVGKAKEVLASASSEVSARQDQLADLTKQQMEAEGAIVAARAEQVRVMTDADRAATNLEDLRLQIETKRRDLASLAQQQEDGGNATPRAAGAGAASKPMGGGRLASAVSIVSAIVSALVVAAVAMMYLTRKPPKYTFSLLDEASKSSYRIEMSRDDRVDLDGGQPTKKIGSGNGRVPFLTINRKGRLALHPATDFSTKLSDRPISTTDIPTVKPGNVIEITANGQVSRLVVGPVSAVNQNQHLHSKLPTASVRTGATSTT